jgi:serine protease
VKIEDDETSAATPQNANTEPPDDLAELLAAWQDEQALPQVADALPTRFVVELAGRSAVEVGAEAAARLGVRTTARPLFPQDAELNRFHLLVIEGVSRPDRADLFEVAAVLRDTLGAETVDPDLGTDYFTCDDPAPAPGTPESADWAFWCWADPETDRPDDADWAIAKTLVRDAWRHALESGKGAKGSGVVIFQPDTGIVPGHAQVPRGSAEDPRAANFVEGSGTAIDPMRGGGNPGHGTGTASVVASPEAGRMTGAAPLASLVPIRCVEKVAVFDQSPVAEAIEHARRNGAHVITMSLGGVMSAALHAAVSKAVRDNVIVVAAAGNCVGEVVWPARYPEVIAIGGVNAAFEPWRGSSRGPAVAISAPAEFVTRADPRDPREPLAAVGGGQGTSFATALIAGIAALWLAYHDRDKLLALLPPGRTLQLMFRNLLAATAQVPPGFDTANLGAGIVDALALLRFDPKRAFDPGIDRAERAEDGLEGLVALVERAFGREGAEAVGPLLDERQHAAEIACAALDRIRAGRTFHAHVESMPPPILSPRLRSRLAPHAAVFR